MKTKPKEWTEAEKRALIRLVRAGAPMREKSRTTETASTKGKRRAGVAPKRTDGKENGSGRLGEQLRARLGESQVGSALVHH